MKEKRNISKWIYWFTFAIAVIVIYKTLDNFNEISAWFKKLGSILMPFFMGILLSYLLYIPCRRIEKCYKNLKLKFINKRARGLSVITVYIMAILLITIIINILIPALSKSVQELASNLPGYYQNAISFVDNMPEDGLIKKESMQNLISELQKIDILKIINLENISDYIQSVVGVAQGIFNVFISIVMSIYILLERGRIVEFVKRLLSAIFKKDTCLAIDNYFIKANNIFFKFISSQIIDALIVGIIVSIGLWILGVKYWILLGFMIGLFNIIPYFGAIIGVLIATIVTILTGGFSKAIWMLVVVIILQQLDANIINPKIIGNALKLSPILVVFSVTLFGAYFGVLGMFLAVPIIAVLKILTNDFIDYRIKKKEEEKC